MRGRTGSNDSRSHSRRHRSAAALAMRNSVGWMASAAIAPCGMGAGGWLEAGSWDVGPRVHRRKMSRLLLWELMHEFAHREIPQLDEPVVAAG